MSNPFSLLKRIEWIIRHGLFYALIIPATMFITTMGLLTFIFGQRAGYWSITRWSWLYVKWAKFCFQLNYQVTGLENLPKTACIVAANHQSNWETIFMQVLLPRQSWVLKRELLWIPFFGWGLAFLRPIAIRRTNKSSIKQLIREGTRRLEENRWVVIYPEGTRLDAKAFKPFSRSAAALAVHAKSPIVPIAHNAGHFWPKGPWIKRKGTIHIHIGKPLHVDKSQTTNEITQHLADWINSERRKLPPFTD